MQHFPRYHKSILVSSAKDTFADDFRTGQLAKVEARIQAHPEELQDLVALLQAPDVAMQVRIGISAILETLTGDSALAPLIPLLGELSQQGPEHIRSDACYFLGLTQQQQALPYLEAACRDKHSEVRASATEALDDIPRT